MRKVGTIDFEFVGDPVTLEVHVFLTEKFKGMYRRFGGAYSTMLDIYGDMMMDVMAIPISELQNLVDAFIMKGRADVTRHSGSIWKEIVNDFEFVFYLFRNLLRCVLIFPYILICPRIRI